MRSCRQKNDLLLQQMDSDFPVAVGYIYPIRMEKLPIKFYIREDSKFTTLKEKGGRLIHDFNRENLLGCIRSSDKKVLYYSYHSLHRWRNGKSRTVYELRSTQYGYDDVLEFIESHPSYECKKVRNIIILPEDVLFDYMDTMPVLL